MIYKRALFGIPLAPRKNRRWLVAAYWAAAAAFTLAAIAAFHAHQQWRNSWPILAGWMVLLVANLGVGAFMHDRSMSPNRASGGIRTLFDASFRKAQKAYPPADERERHEWDVAYRHAYLLLCLMILLFGYAYAGRLIPHQTYGCGPLGILLFVAMMNLPQSVLLWRQPDLEAER